MRKRGSARSDRKQNKKNQTKKKKKLTCCQRCCRRIRRRICRRIKRCIKRKVFGLPEPHLDDYDLAGYNLGSIRDIVKRDKSKEAQGLKDKVSQNSKNKNINIDKRKSVITLFRNNNMKSYKQAVTDELDRYSLMGFDNKWSMKSIMDFRERSIFKNIKSKFNLSKEKLSNLYMDLDKDSKLLKSLSVTALKKKFSITGSKQIILNRMLDDYKKGKLHLSNIKKGSKLDFLNLDKDTFHKILRDYENKQQTNLINDLFKKSVADLKKKFSVSGSEEVILKKMKADYNKKKLSLSFLKNLSKFDLRNINAERFRKIIKEYENKHKKQKVSFVRESKLEQVRSFVKSKFLDKF